MEKIIKSFRYAQHALTAVALCVLAYYVIDGINALVTITHTPLAIVWLVFIVCCAIGFISSLWALFIATVISEHKPKIVDERTPQIEVKFTDKKMTMEDWYKLDSYYKATREPKPSANGKHKVTIKEA